MLTQKSPKREIKLEKVVVPEGMAALIKELEQPNEKVRNIFDEVIIITE